MAPRVMIIIILPYALAALHAPDYNVRSYYKNYYTSEQALLYSVI